MEPCEYHKELNDAVVSIKKSTEEIHEALLGTMANPKGALSKIDDLTEWKEARQNDIKTLTYRLVSFVGGIIVMAAIATISISKWIIGG